MTLPDQAVQTFNSGYNCSQSILSTYGARFGLDRACALKIAAGFGGGIGAQGDICGALSGAIMVLGLRFAVAQVDKIAKAEMYAKTRLLIEQFKRRAAAVNCRDLLGFDLSTPEGQQKANLPGSFDVCPGLVRIAADLLEEMLK
ncbi:MAG: C-GCAxxG-C-C family protein [Planctomycetaceae bacterium]|nr:C-GCAxxG-C-C family protein [Planctomycetaceae bacterium]